MEHFFFLWSVFFFSLRGYGRGDVGDGSGGEKDWSDRRVVVGD